MLATGIYGTDLVGVEGNYDDVNRLCTELCAERELGVREHQPAPVLRRGLQDARLRDRRAARLGAARPLRRADRLRLAVHEDRQGLQEWIELGLRRGRAAGDERRPGRGLRAGRAARSPPATTSAGRSSRTRSPSRWRSATRPTAPTRSTSRAAPAARSTPSPTRRSGAGIACSPRRRASSPRPPAASRPPCSRKLAERGDIDPDERVVVVHHRRGPEDARCGPRHVRDATTIEPTLDAFEAAAPAERSSRLMAVMVKIPTQLRAAAGGESEAEVEGATVRRCSTACSTASTSCASGSPTTTARCGASSTSTSPGEDIRFLDGLATPVADGAR